MFERIKAKINRAWLIYTWKSRNFDWKSQKLWCINCGRKKNLSIKLIASKINLKC